jgi:hypothetical protein
LMDRYPSPQLLRQMIQTNAPLPNDPMKHAIYADQIAFYKIAQKRKQAADAAAAAAQGAEGMSAADQGMGTPRRAAAILQIRPDATTIRWRSRQARSRCRVITSTRRRLR